MTALLGLFKSPLGYLCIGIFAILGIFLLYNNEAIMTSLGFQTKSALLKEISAKDQLLSQCKTSLALQATNCDIAITAASGNCSTKLSNATAQCEVEKDLLVKRCRIDPTYCKINIATVTPVTPKKPSEEHTEPSSDTSTIDTDLSTADKFSRSNIEAITTAYNNLFAQEYQP